MTNGNETPATVETGETVVDEFTFASTPTVAAAGLIGIACILMGGDLLNRSLKQLAERGTSLPAVLRGSSIPAALGE